MELMRTGTKFHSKRRSYDEEIMHCNIAWYQSSCINAEKSFGGCIAAKWILYERHEIFLKKVLPEHGSCVIHTKFH